MLTVPGTHVHGAGTAALGLIALHQLGEVVALHVQTAADYDHDHGRTPVGDVRSTTSAG